MAYGARRDPSALTIAGAALLGALAALFKYLDAASGIAETPGALLVIITSMLIGGIGFILPQLRQRTASRRWLLGVCLVLIAGTAFAAYLLESNVLLVLMIVCLLAWGVIAFRRPIATQVVA